MRLTAAIDRFIGDMRLEGRITSAATERDYRGALVAHAQDVGNRDPTYTNREDVKRTLARWPNPNSRRKQRSILVSFYDWVVEEGTRPHNPARQTRRPKRQPTAVYRMTRAEAVRLLLAAAGQRERRAIYLGVCAGLRNRELRGLQGRHLSRSGAIWVSAEIAKGGKERWVPVIRELEPIVAEIQEHSEPDDYVLPAQRWRDPGTNGTRADKRKSPSSSQALRQLVIAVARRAGIPGHVTPHTLRHACADHIAKHAGVRVAQLFLGHAGIGSTEAYLGGLSLDELAGAVADFSYASSIERTFYPPLAGAAKPVEATTGIEPV